MGVDHPLFLEGIKSTVCTRGPAKLCGFRVWFYLTFWMSLSNNGALIYIF